MGFLACAPALPVFSVLYDSRGPQKSFSPTCPFYGWAQPVGGGAHYLRPAPPTPTPTPSPTSSPTSFSGFGGGMLPPGGRRHTLQVLFNSPSSGAWAPARSRGDGRRSGQKPNVRVQQTSRMQWSPAGWAVERVVREDRGRIGIFQEKPRRQTRPGSGTVGLREFGGPRRAPWGQLWEQVQRAGPGKPA